MPPNESSLPQPSFSYPGMIPIFPWIMAFSDPNTTECICQDLQEEDYSPLYAWFNYVLIICMLPPLSVFGVLTNVVNVFIYSRKRMRNSANTYLLFLGFSDFLVILTGLFIFWIDSARSYIPELARAPYTTVYALPFGYMAQSCSIYFTVAAAVDCYVTVCWKSIAHSYCNVRRARQVISTIVFFSIIYNSLRFPQFNLHKCLHESSQEVIIEICPTTLYYMIDTIYNVYLYMVLMTLLPFFFLLLLNAFIVYKQSAEAAKSRRSSSLGSPNKSSNKSSRIGSVTSASQNRHKDVAKTDSSSNGAKEESMPVPPESVVGSETSSDDTITMIMVVVLFLCCNTLALVVNLIESFFDPDPILLNLLSDASNFLVIFNSSVNCVIYVVFNKDFREIFMRHWHKTARYLQSCFCSSKRSGSGLRKSRFVYGTVPCEKYDSYIYPKMPLNVQTRRPPDATNGEKPPKSGGSSPQSPIWQPLAAPEWSYSTAQSGQWPTQTTLTRGTELKDATPSQADVSRLSFEPSELLLMDEDSGWDDGCSSQILSSPRRGCQTTSYFAEVQIMDNDAEGQPYICVKPVYRRSPLSGRRLGKMSITEL